ncbi:MAG TPA: nitronate monooxygenase [Longimicrobium sp.]|nr:nitronate monooxygenase [Longimicrobium sp.]
MDGGWTALAARLGMRYPIILAPLAGGPSTPALVAAVSAAGGLGSLGAAYLAPEQIRDEIARVRRLTDRPFAVNLFAGGATGGADDTGPMLALLARWHRALGLEPPTLAAPPADRFGEQLEAVLRGGPPAAFSFTFGIPDGGVMAELRRLGVFLMGTATTVDEARALEEAGVDAVVAQGSEAGGHRGTFRGSFEAGMVGTMALVPQVADAVRVPVVASGGIMDGRGIVAAQALGAAAVQLGTAFLATDEAGTPAPYRARLLAAGEDATALTRAYSGRPARGIRTTFMDQVEREGIPIPPFPLQNALTRPLRTAAARAGESDALSLWAGQGLRLLRTGSAATLVQELATQSERIRAGLRAGTALGVGDDPAPAASHP